MFTMMKEFESTEKNDFVSNGDDSLNLINILDTEDFYRNYDAITKENADIAFFTSCKIVSWDQFF